MSAPANVAESASPPTDRLPGRVPGGWRRPGLPGAATALGILSAVVVAGVLRLRDLGAVGFGSDEAVYAALVRGISEGELVVRAHPPLWFALSALLGTGADVALRALTAAVSLAAIPLTAVVAAALPVAAPRAAAVAAAWLVAVMPYHVDVSRQFLLDGPVTAMLTLLVVAVLRLEATGRRRWLWVIGASAASAFLIKETATLVLAAVVLVGLLAPGRHRRTAAVIVAVALASAGSLWWALAALSGQASQLASYAGWQVERAPNHSIAFYGDVVAPAVGLPVLLAAILGGLWLARRKRGALILAWAALPIGFFQFWPVKGYAYLAIAVPALAALAAVAIVQMAVLVGPRLRSIAAVATAVAVSVPLAASHASASPRGPIPGRDGLPDVREAAQWLAERGGGSVVVDNVAVGNVVEYYSGAQVAVIGHVPGDSRLNPAYRSRPAAVGRAADFLVWDAWTAATEPHRAAQLIAEARRLHARVGFVGASASSPGDARSPAVVVFEVPT